MPRTPVLKNRKHFKCRFNLKILEIKQNNKISKKAALLYMGSAIKGLT
jgi:hypothetical protein